MKELDPVGRLLLIVAGSISVGVGVAGPYGGYPYGYPYPFGGGVVVGRPLSP